MARTWQHSNSVIYTHVQNNITLDNYEEVITNVSGAVRGAIIDEQEQTTSNLAMVTAAIQKSAALISETTVISNTVSLLLVCSNIDIRRYVTWSNRSVSLSLSDSAELDQHFGGTTTVECRCAALSDKERDTERLDHVTHLLFEQTSSKLTVFGMTVVSLMSAADLCMAAVTIARLLVVCSCSSMIAPLTAPLTFVITSS